MIAIKKILFPTDFSARAEGAFTHAAYLSDLFDAELHVLNAVEAPMANPDDPMSHLSLKREDEDTWSDAFMREAGAARVVHAQVESGAPGEGILEYAERHEIDLVVMATHGRQGLDRLLLGSVAEEVVRRALCPVITIRNTETAPKLWSRILVPIDFSEPSKLTLAYAKELAQISGASLDLLHVIEEAVFPTIYGVDTFAVAVPSVVEQSRKRLAELAEEIAGSEISFTCHVRIGQPAAEIVAFAREYGSDLIPIATHGLTGLQRFLIGSVTERVVRHAPCAVFTVKASGKILVGGLDEPLESARADA